MSKTIEVKARELPSTPPPPPLTLIMRKGPKPGQQFSFTQDIIPSAGGMTTTWS